MLNTTMTVTRPVDTVSAGTTTTTYAAHLSAVPCRWHRMSGAEAVRYGAERVTRMWRGSVDATVDIVNGDRCVFANATGQRTVHVIDTQDSSGAGIIRVIEAEEVTGDA
jgi:hypothetical protein